MSANSKVEGHTPGEWCIAGRTDGMMDAPKGFSVTQKAKWDALVAEQRKPMRENDGSFIIMAGSPRGDDRKRIGSVTLQVKAKRGHAHEADDPEALSNARLIASAPDLLDALQALERAISNNEPFSRAEHEKVRAAIAKATGAQS